MGEPYMSVDLINGFSGLNGVFNIRAVDGTIGTVRLTGNAVGGNVQLLRTSSARIWRYDSLDHFIHVDDNQTFTSSSTALGAQPWFCRSGTSGDLYIVFDDASGTCRLEDGEYAVSTKWGNVLIRVDTDGMFQIPIVGHFHYVDADTRANIHVYVQDNIVLDVADQMIGQMKWSDGQEWLHWDAVEERNKYSRDYFFAQHYTYATFSTFWRMYHEFIASCHHKPHATCLLVRD